MVGTVPARVEVGGWRCVEREATRHGIERWRARRVGEGAGPEEAVVHLLALPEQAAAREMLERWYEDLRDLADPRFPRVLAWKRGRGALVLEAVRGVPLERLLAEARAGRCEVDLPTALDIVLEVARGLRHAHGRRVRGRPVVHGRIGPATVWLTPDGDVRVTGLGAPTLLVEARALPPEMAARSSAGVRSDQWQVAALLYELLTLRPLYPGSWAEAFRAAVRGAVDEQVARVTAFHPRLGEVLRRALAPLPRHRFPDDHAFIEALVKVARAAGPGTSRRRELAARLCGDLVRVPAAPAPAPVEDAIPLPPWVDEEPVVVLVEDEEPPAEAGVSDLMGAPRIEVGEGGGLAVRFLPPEDPADTGDRVEVSVPGGAPAAPEGAAVADSRAMAPRGRGGALAVVLLAVGGLVLLWGLG